MKTSTMGMVSAAILIIVAGVGFGIAQAGGNQPYDPMLSFGDQDVNPCVDMGLGVEFCPEDYFAGTDWQTRETVETGSMPACSYDPTLCFGDNDVNPYILVQAREAVETGAIPVTVPENSWMEEYGND